MGLQVSVPVKQLQAPSLPHVSRFSPLGVEVSVSYDGPKYAVVHHRLRFHVSTIAAVLDHVPGLTALDDQVQVSGRRLQRSCFTLGVKTFRNIPGVSSVGIQEPVPENKPHLCLT